MTHGSSTFEQFLKFVPDAIVGVGGDGPIVLVNRRTEELLRTVRELLDRPPGDDA